PLGHLPSTTPPPLGHPICLSPYSLAHPSPPSPIGHPIAYGPSSTGLPHMPQLPFLSHPINPLSQAVTCRHSSLSCLMFQSLGPPITYYCISLFHIPYCYMFSYLTLDHPTHYSQLHPWAHS
ncbi:hypothetical protein PAXRUDRAFT_167570, partial [Paxillus rubicundulus Ve08.2h10]